MISDTVRVYLRSFVSPYSVIDSSVTKCDTTGYGRYYFTGISDGVNYYIVLKHRNSIETWSASAQSFTSGILNYDFTSSISQAFGNNMIQIDASPVRFAVYSGDVNQDGTVDVSDNGLIDNDAANFMSGYIPTDLNGDEITDVSDAAIADNNAVNFVSVVNP
ncbi:MAG: hypothetical protein IPM38_10130 [Ignavibacteria bacterium]|nr:hypothetical protein [Ignavibacteria bacterium]